MVVMGHLMGIFMVVLWMSSFLAIIAFLVLAGICYSGHLARIRPRCVGFMIAEGDGDEDQANGSMAEVCCVLDYSSAPL
jgi:hypothetical protein